jgi:hypothetical protein
MSFGMSLNLLAAREFYEARLDALEAQPYQCEFFAGVQEAVAGGREVLNQPMFPLVYSFKGFLATIDSIKGMDIQAGQPPTDIDMQMLIATDNAEGLVAMAAMFSPEIAALDLQADGKPVRLPVPPIASQVRTAWVAMSDAALALSVGEGGETHLPGMLTEPALRAVGEGDQRQHHRHLDQHADHGDQRRAGVQAEQPDGHRHRQLEEVRGADQRARRGHIERHPPQIGRA